MGVRCGSAVGEALAEDLGDPAALGLADNLEASFPLFSLVQEAAVGEDAALSHSHPHPSFCCPVPLGLGGQRASLWASASTSRPPSGAWL